MNEHFNLQYIYEDISAAKFVNSLQDVEIAMDGADTNTLLAGVIFTSEFVIHRHLYASMFIPSMMQTL